VVVGVDVDVDVVVADVVPESWAQAASIAITASATDKRLNTRGV
jgi:hypothetical protein